MHLDMFFTGPFERQNSWPFSQDEFLYVSVSYPYVSRKLESLYLSLERQLQKSFNASKLIRGCSKIMSRIHFNHLFQNVTRWQNRMQSPFIE